ncbi:MAG: methyltransferase domain-containing protein [Arcobacter sp.]|nr:methyltransferase domain-containing protein [Arcobacter sp.]
MLVKYSLTNNSMFEILKILKLEFIKNQKSEISFEALNPDFLSHSYAGTSVLIDGENYIYRGYKSWTDLAEILGCKMMTPTINKPHTVILKFIKLDIDSSFHKTKIEEKSEKYGVDSTFFAINKNEEPAFLEHYLRALKNVDIKNKKRILNLGINSGDEFDVIKSFCKDVSDKKFVGIDFCKTVINVAKKRFSEANFSFYSHDINQLDELNLGKFDLIITIGTLQSSGLEFKPLFASLIQKYLEKDGAMIVGFPNCRWVDGEIIYGSKAPNYNFSEHTLLYKDVYFCKKYLQQKKFRVSITGKNYPFLTATSIRKEDKLDE